MQTYSDFGDEISAFALSPRAFALGTFEAREGFFSLVSLPAIEVYSMEL